MVTLSTLQKMKTEQAKIAMLTCYEASFATLLDNVGIDILLIGDSLGMTIQGHSSTLPVTLEQMCYHTDAVARGANNALVLADLSFGSYQQSKEQAFDSASKLMAAGAHMVKLEGGNHMVETTRFLQERGIPVCTHLGLTPQSVNAFGGYKVQGKTDAAARQLIADAQVHEQAGASMVLLECVPAEIAKEITTDLQCPVIGIGAGINCDGQVLVLHDILGIYAGKSPKFSKNFMQGQSSIQEAINAYVKAVKEGSFPTLEHSF